MVHGGVEENRGGASGKDQRLDLDCISQNRLVIEVENSLARLNTSIWTGIVFNYLRPVPFLGVLPCSMRIY